MPDEVEPLPPTPDEELVLPDDEDDGVPPPGPPPPLAEVSEPPHPGANESAAPTKTRLRPTRCFIRELLRCKK